MILVTGATGLIGSHLCERLVAEGYEVVGLIHSRGNPVIEDLLKCENFRLDMGDIRFQRTSFDIIVKYKIKTIFHTAAQLPYTHNPDLLGVNIGGTNGLLKVAHTYGVKEFIYASSMGVYTDPPNYIPVNEIHPTEPNTEYGRTKLAGERLCQRYAGIMKVLILRYAGVYGVSSEKYRAVNNFIRCALKNESLVVNGDGSQSSDFTYVDDIVEGTYLAWKNNVQGVFNIGSGQDISIIELARMIIKITNSKSEIMQNGNKIERPFRFYLDISKAKKDFGYSPRLLEEGLREYVRDFSE